MSFYSILLDAAPAAADPKAQGNPMLMNILMIGLIIVVFYFFMIRPQRQKQKETNNFLGEIGKGTKIVTIGGIVAKVLEVRNKTFLIETENGGRLQVLKSAISLENSKALNNDTDDKKEKKEKEKEKEEA